LSAYQASGLSQSAFARANGLSQPTMSYWLRKSRERKDEKVEDARRLVPVKVSAVPPGLSGATGPGFELDLPGGLRLWIPADFDDGALQRLLSILAVRC
jgi:transcriptional regulator with XRE-family HTH domain